MMTFAERQVNDASSRAATRFAARRSAAEHLGPTRPICAGEWRNLELASGSDSIYV